MTLFQSRGRRPAQRLRDQEARSQGENEEPHDSQHGSPAELGYILKGETEPKECYAEAQERGGGQRDAWLCLRVGGHVVERHAQEKREEHGRRAVVLRQEACREGDDDG